MHYYSWRVLRSFLFSVVAFGAGLPVNTAFALVNRADKWGGRLTHCTLVSLASSWASCQTSKVRAENNIVKASCWGGEEIKAVPMRWLSTVLSSTTFPWHRKALGETAPSSPKPTHDQHRRNSWSGRFLSVFFYILTCRVYCDTWQAAAGRH